MQNHQKGRGGFTLIEILVVLAIVAIISSISFGAFRSVSDGNKRTNCQTNLQQIYKSMRLYAQDYDGRFPYLNAGGATNQPDPDPDKDTRFGGIGLWALYAYPTATGNLCTPTTFSDYSSDLNLPPASADGNQLAGYVRSSKIFHCPADRFNKDVQLRTSSACVTQNVPTASLTIKVSGVDEPYLNPAFLSYQTVDDIGTLSAGEQDTYSSFRKPGSATSATRQLRPYSSTSGVNTLLDRPTKDMTVVTWCRFHRSLNENGATQNGSRNFDNVLFSDGSVQSIAAEQTVTDTAGNPGNCSNWQRVPREKAESMQSASGCTPTP